MINIIASSRLRGQAQPEPNVFINGIGDQINTVEDIFNNSYLLNGDPALASNLKNNGKDISFHYNGKFFGFGDLATGVTDIFLLEDVLFNIFSTSLEGSINSIRNILIPKSNFSTNFQALRGISVKKFYAPLITTLSDNVLNNQVFRDTNNVDFICDNVLSTINSGSPDGDIIYLINNWNGSVTYSTDKTTPTAPTISATTNIGGTFVELNVSQPAHVNTLKYALVFVDGFFQYIYDINNVFVTNLQEQTSYDIKVIIADEYFNISPYSNTINVTTTTTPALFQNSVAYYKLGETSGDAIDVVNGYNGALFGGVTQGVAGKIGTAYSFDGTDGRVDLPISIYNNLNSNNFSFGIWFKTNNVTKTQLIISDFETSLTQRRLYCFVRGASQNLRLAFSDDSVTQFIDSFTILNDTWYFLQIKHNANGVQEMKLNNVSQGTHTFVNAPTLNQEITLGNQTTTNDFPFDGVIDEVSFINGQTTAQQDNDLYNNGNGTTI